MTRMVPRWWPTRAEAAAIAAPPKVLSMVQSGNMQAVILPPLATEAERVALSEAFKRTQRLNINGGRGQRS